MILIHDLIEKLRLKLIWESQPITHKEVVSNFRRFGYLSEEAMTK